MAAALPPLIHALRNPAAYAHPVAGVEVIETHISWVLLAGPFAYKIKKPVVLPFVDFGSLAARQRFCAEELRLNRRLAPALYLDVLPVTGSTRRPRMGGTGTALEYAVRMRRFDQDGLFDRLVARGALTPALIERLAARIAAFHAAAPATVDPAWTDPDRILQPALANFDALLMDTSDDDRTRLWDLRDWTRTTFERLAPAFAERPAAGRIRECHGDLHLGNIALVDGEPVAFDCIEFDPALRWIDVINEAAFLVMDLMAHARPDLGFRFLDAYLGATGDYVGVALLRFYIVYRALVRVKVGLLRPDGAAAAARYLRLADAATHPARPALILMHGFSGAGKSRVAAALAADLGAIRLRSDLERKRLFGLGGEDASGSAVGGGIYTQDAGTRTYARLAELARTLVDARYPVVLDATFLAHAERMRFRALARELGVPLRIVDCHADPATLRTRIEARATAGGDPSEATAAVLEHQLETHDAFTEDECPAVIRCRMEGSEAAAVAACVGRVRASLAGPQARTELPAER